MLQQRVSCRRVTFCETPHVSQELAVFHGEGEVCPPFLLDVAIATAPIIAVWTIGAAGWRSAAWMLTLGAGALATFAALVIMDADPPPEPPDDS